MDGGGGIASGAAIESLAARAGNVGLPKSSLLTQASTTVFDEHKNQTERRPRVAAAEHESGGLATKCYGLDANNAAHSLLNWLSKIADTELGVVGVVGITTWLF